MLRRNELVSTTKNILDLYYGYNGGITTVGENNKNTTVAEKIVEQVVSMIQKQNRDYGQALHERSKND